MTDYFSKIFGEINEFIKKLSPAKKAGLFFTSAVVVGGLVSVFMWAGNKTYSPIVSGASPEDAANIIRVLRDKRIPFKVDETSRNIMVPTESMLELRMELATMGLSSSTVVGNEVFDKQSLGTTSLVQKINEKRAKEGELIRTINTIRGVKRSRVHLAIPQKSAFVEDQKKSTASVIIDLDPGVVLHDKQVTGITTLVSRAVEGLDQNDVVVVNSEGKLLSKNHNDPLAVATATQLDYRQRLESDMEKRVEEILSKVVGEGHVVAKVTADVDFSQSSETTTTFDADGAAVKSVLKNTSSMEGSRPSPGGVAGAQANLPGAQADAKPPIKTDTKTSNETINYNVPETVKQTRNSTGSLKKLSVAVVIDGKTVRTTDKDGKVETKMEAWTKDQLQEFETLVSGTLAINKKRGDTLDIRSMEFTREDFSGAEKLAADAERKQYLQNLIVYAVIGITIVLFFFHVVRPFIKWVTENTMDSVDTFLPQTLEELEKLQKNQALPGLEEIVPELPERMDPEKVEGEMIKEKIISLIDSNPHKAALILRDWLHDEVLAGQVAANEAKEKASGDKSA